VINSRTGPVACCLCRKILHRFHPSHINSNSVSIPILHHYSGSFTSQFDHHLTRVHLLQCFHNPPILIDSEHHLLGDPHGEGGAQKTGTGFTVGEENKQDEPEEESKVASKEESKEESKDESKEELSHD
jgi:hypothetical protein